MIRNHAASVVDAWHPESNQGGKRTGILSVLVAGLGSKGIDRAHVLVVAIIVGGQCRVGRSASRGSGDLMYGSVQRPSSQAWPFG